jgi:hypothetical protein
MKTSRIEKRLSRPTIWLAGAIVLIMADCTSSEAATRKKALTTASSSSAQQAKPIKLRYYGGPKYPRYPE